MHCRTVSIVILPLPMGLLTDQIRAMGTHNRRRTDLAGQAWGAAPTPLIPGVLRRELGHVDAPPSLTEAVGAKFKLGALDHTFWHCCSSLDGDARNDLIEVATAAIRDNPDWPVLALQPSSMLDFDLLALNGRTKAALKEAFPQGPRELNGITFGELLEIPHIGPKSALEIACTVEWGSRWSRQQRHNQKRLAVMQAQREHVPEEVSTFFRMLASWVSGERGETTLEQVLPEADTEWPSEIQYLWNRLITSDAKKLAGGFRMRYFVPALIERAFAECDERHRLILQARVFTTTRPTAVEALAKVFNISVNEARALESQAMRSIERIRSTAFAPLHRRADAIRERLGAAIPERDPEVAKALNANFEGQEITGTRQFEKDLLLWLAGPYKWDGGWLVAPPDIAKQSTQALMDRKNESGIIENSEVQDALNELRIRPTHHHAWVKRLGRFARSADGIVPKAFGLAGS